MRIVIQEKKRDFTVMSNHHFRNRELSYKAMGLLSFMLSLPEDWDFSVEGLAHCAKDGRDSITTGLKELEQKGYLVRRKVRNERGRIIDVEYVVCEKPQQLSTEESADEKMKETPFTDFPKTVKSDLVKNDIDSKNVIKSTFSPETENPETVNYERISPFTEKPLLENPITEKPLLENPQQINTNIINTNILNTKEINTNDLSSSDDDKKSIKDRLGYYKAVKVSSEEIAEIVYGELCKEPQLLNEIDAGIFSSVCENIALYSNTINNQGLYIRACVTNMLTAKKINQSTFNGALKRPVAIKGDDYISLSG